MRWPGPGFGRDTFVEQISQMKLDRVDGNAELAGQFLIGVTFGQGLKQGAFALGQGMSWVLVELTDIEERKHHLAGSDISNDVEQFGRGLATGTKACRTCSHGVTWDVTVVVVRIDDDAWRFGLGPQNLQQFFGSEHGQRPVNHGCVNRDPENGFEKTFSGTGSGDKAENAGRDQRIPTTRRASAGCCQPGQHRLLLGLLSFRFACLCINLPMWVVNCEFHTPETINKEWENTYPNDRPKAGVLDVVAQRQSRLTVTIAQCWPGDRLKKCIEPVSGGNIMQGTKGLFVPGPTNIPHVVRQAIDVPMEDHRAPDLPEFTLPLFSDLKKIFKTQSAQVFVFPSSGTGGWEAAITNTLVPGR